jgi:hypothetical protein
MEADLNNVLMSCRNLESLTLVETDLDISRLRRGRLPLVRELRFEDCHGNLGCTSRKDSTTFGIYHGSGTFI